MTTFKKAAFIAASALAFALSACSDGSDGKNGINGANGIDGVSCHVFADQTQSHAYSVYCGDLLVGYLDNGQNGADGATGEKGSDGISCSVAEDETHAHAYIVYCGGSLMGYLDNGSDGADGESCAASASGDLALGDIKITCGSDVKYIKNGAKGDKGEDGMDGQDGQDGAKGDKGESCSVVEDDDKTAITCEDGSESVIAKFGICNNALYNRTADFCGSDDVVYSKCDGAGYEVTTHFCGSDDLIYDKSTHLYDARDGQAYKYVTIGTQVWMAENLNYETESGSKCYDNDPNNCAAFGRLYDWAMAMGISSSYNSSSYTASANHKGICPTGWHIPSDAEWTALTDYLGGTTAAGTKLKSASGWNNSGNGTDNYGFSALPGGDGSSDGSFYDVGDFGYWWSATEYDSNYAYYRDMGYSYGIVGSSSLYKSDLSSVRCLKD